MTALSLLSLIGAGRVSTTRFKQVFRLGETGFHPFFEGARQEGLNKSKDPSRLYQGGEGASGPFCHWLKEQRALFDGARTPEMPMPAFLVQLILRDFTRRLSRAPHKLPGFRDPGADAHRLFRLLPRCFQARIGLPQRIVPGVGQKGEHVLDGAPNDDADGIRNHAAFSSPGQS